LLTERFLLAVKAHKEKRSFIERLLSLGEDGPLALLSMRSDGTPYLRMDRVTHLIGMVGLNEMVKAHRGEELHESREALKFGLKVIAHLKKLCDRVRQTEGLRLALEQTPAESTAYRFARLDLRYFSPKALRIVKGDISKTEVYYTNSTHLNVGVPMNPIERVTKEGMFHPMIDAGSITHIWLGEARPSKEAIADFVAKVVRHTTNDQIAFSPEFTTCNACSRTFRGLWDRCIYCSSTNVEGITRITGYFTKISSWNKGKLGELRDRYRAGEHFDKAKVVGKYA
jgi:ribonucleoside-triphosphate reductase